jgi:hypothetical protein
MPAKTPRAVLDKISQYITEDGERKGEELLRYMAESKNIDVSDSSKDRKAFLFDLSTYISSLGLSVLLKLLTIKLLDALLDKKFTSSSKKSEKKNREK